MIYQTRSEDTNHTNQSVDSANLPSNIIQECLIRVNKTKEINEIIQKISITIDQISGREFITPNASKWGIEKIVAQLTKDLLIKEENYTIKISELSYTLRHLLGNRVYAFIRTKLGGILSILTRQHKSFLIISQPPQDLVTFVNKNRIIPTESSVNYSFLQHLERVSSNETTHSTSSEGGSFTTGLPSSPPGLGGERSPGSPTSPNGEINQTEGSNAQYPSTITSPTVPTSPTSPNGISLDYNPQRTSKVNHNIPLATNARANMILRPPGVGATHTSPTQNEQLLQRRPSYTKPPMAYGESGHHSLHTSQMRRGGGQPIQQVITHPPTGTAGTGHDQQHQHDRNKGHNNHNSNHNNNAHHQHHNNNSNNNNNHHSPPQPPFHPHTHTQTSSPHNPQNYDQESINRFCDFSVSANTFIWPINMTKDAPFIQLIRNIISHSTIMHIRELTENIHSKLNLTYTRQLSPVVLRSFLLSYPHEFTIGEDNFIYYIPKESQVPEKRVRASSVDRALHSDGGGWQTSPTRGVSGSGYEYGSEVKSGGGTIKQSTSFTGIHTLYTIYMYVYTICLFTDINMYMPYILGFGSPFQDPSPGSPFRSLAAAPTTTTTDPLGSGRSNGNGSAAIMSDLRSFSHDCYVSPRQAPPLPGPPNLRLLEHLPGHHSIYTHPLNTTSITTANSYSGTGLSYPNNNDDRQDTQSCYSLFSGREGSIFDGLDTYSLHSHTYDTYDGDLGGGGYSDRDLGLDIDNEHQHSQQHDTNNNNNTTTTNNNDNNTNSNNNSNNSIVLFDFQNLTDGHNMLYLSKESTRSMPDIHLSTGTGVVERSLRMLSMSDDDDEGGELDGDDIIQEAV